MGHIAHVLKHSLQPLRDILRNYELQGTLPTQMVQSLIVMLPKNERCERPITLTSTIYRLWCRLRKDLLGQVQELMYCMWP